MFYFMYLSIHLPRIFCFFCFSLIQLYLYCIYVCACVHARIYTKCVFFLFLFLIMLCVFDMDSNEIYNRQMYNMSWYLWSYLVLSPSLL